MTTSKDSSGHTPGEWVVRDHIGVEGNPHPRVYGPENAEMCPLAEVYDRFGRSNGYGGDIEEIRANARLIAAAPKMLEALEALIPHVGTSAMPSLADYRFTPGNAEAVAARDAAVERALTAISNATGKDAA